MGRRIGRGLFRRGDLLGLLGLFRLLDLFGLGDLRWLFCFLDLLADGFGRFERSWSRSGYRGGRSDRRLGGRGRRLG
jgi:hypothetical protein